MKRRIISLILIYLIITLISNSFVSLAQGNNEAILKAGAAKVDITPEQNELPERFLGIYDRIYSRTIVVTNGKNTVALVSLDIG